MNVPPGNCLMKYCLSFILVFLLTHLSWSQDRVVVTIPSAAQEADYIWQTIRDISFFEEHGYEVNLPEGELISTLKQKARSGQLSDADQVALTELMVDEVYRKKDYLPGFKHIEAQLKSLNLLIDSLHAMDFAWDFKVYEEYRVNLSLYGPGGSYDPYEGSILLCTTSNGDFKGYKNPTNTIIHEIVHIGIEESIVLQYQVPHTMKERIVDTFVSLHFKEFLPEYRIQDMGEYRTDSYLDTVEDIVELDSIVQDILKEE